MSVKTLLGKYRLFAEAQGLSPNTISHVNRCIGFFNKYMGGITDVSQVTDDDLRRFIIALRKKSAVYGKKARFIGGHLCTANCMSSVTSREVQTCH